MKNIVFITLLTMFVLVVAFIPRPSSFECYNNSLGSANDWGGAPQTPPTIEEMKKCEDKVSDLMDRLAKKDVDCIKSKDAAMKQQEKISSDSNQDQQGRAQMMEQSLKDAVDRQKKAEENINQVNKKYNECQDKYVQVEPSLAKCNQDLTREKEKVDILTKQVKEITTQKDEALKNVQEMKTKLMQMEGNYSSCQSAMQRCEQNARRLIMA